MPQQQLPLIISLTLLILIPNCQGKRSCPRALIKHNCYQQPWINKQSMQMNNPSSEVLQIEKNEKPTQIEDNEALIIEKAKW